MKVGDVVKYKRTTKPTPSDWRGVLYGRIGIVTEVCGDAVARVTYPGLKYSPYDLLIRDLEIISEA